MVASLGHDPDKLEPFIGDRAVHVAGVLGRARVLTDGGRTHGRRRKLTRAETKSIALNEWPMLQSSLPVAVPLLLGVTRRIIARDAAATSRCWSVSAHCSSTASYSGLREGRGRINLIVNALVVGSFGVLILLLKIVVH